MIRYFFTLVILLFLCPLSISAQSGIFTSQYYDAGETSDQVTHLATQDGGMIMASVQHPSLTVSYFITIVKTDAAGIVQWTKKFPTVRPGFNTIVQSPDGTYFLCYSEFMFGHHYEALRLDQNGNVLFDKRINLPTGYKVNWKVSAVAKSDSGYYVACSITDTINGTLQWNLLEMSASGNVVWSKTYHAHTFLYAVLGLELCNNGDVLILGSFYDVSTQSYLGLVSRVSANGTLQWSTRFGYAGHDIYPVDAEKQGSSFILAVQDLQQSAGIAAVDFVKIDSTGTLIWEMRYTNTGPNSSLMPYDLISTGNNEYAVLALRSGPALGSVFLKVDGSGQYISSRFYSQFTMMSIEPANAWQYSMAGTRDSMNEHYAVLMTTDLNGIGCDDTAAAFGLGPVTFTATTGGTSANFALTAVPGSLVAVNTGMIQSYRCNITGVQGEESIAPHIDVFPSPGDASIFVRSEELMSDIQVVDLQGRIVQQVACNTLQYEIKTAHLANGVYMIVVHTHQGTTSRRIVVAHA